MRIDLRFILLLLCFFLSGFAALLYETAWAREFAFVFGTSEFAVVSVLAAYMGGLAAGAAVAARLVSRVRRPILVYGLLELGIAASALAVPWGIRAAMWLHTAIAGGQSAPPDEASVAGSLFYVACSFAILMIPTGLMGATLPLLARYAVRRESEIGRRVGVLYSVNTVGAVVGAVAAGFVLLPALGLRTTVYVGAATNALVFGAAALLARRSAPLPELAPSTSAPSVRFHWILPLIALSGFASFTYEVVWIRLLGMLLGGSIQGLATMLASFLLGIAIGSAAAARFARDPVRAAHGFAWAQIGAATLSLIAFSLANRMPELAQGLGAGRAGSLTANALIAALGLLPGALCVGATFPFAVRLFARHESEAGPAAARVYAWNTVGAISGALATGFVLLTSLRFAGTICLAAGLNLFLALATAGLTRPALRVVAGAAAACLAVLVILPPATPWAVLRYNSSNASNWQGEIAYYEVGRSSTVLLFDEGDGWRLVTNGQPESTIQRDSPTPERFITARWLGMLPALLRPYARSMLMIGLGGGLSIEAVPSSIERIHVIELEREVVHAHHKLEALRGFSPISDPRVQLVVNDARGALMLTDARFDAIVSQPSHPWTAGASHLYTREFFSLVSDHLEPGGVFVQWIGLSFVDEPLLRSIVATLLEVFPEIAVFRPVVGSVLFAASNAEFDPVMTPALALAASPSSYSRYGLRKTEDLIAAWSLDLEGAQRFSAGADINTDDRNQLATRSAGLGSEALRPRRANQILSQFDPLPSIAAELKTTYLVRRLAARKELARAVNLAKSQRDSTQRMTNLGWAISNQSPGRAAAHFRAALERDPTSQSARFGLLATRRHAVEANDLEVLELSEPLEGAASATISGWRLAAAGEWPALRELEPELASAEWFDPAYQDAQRLRVQWRTASHDPVLHAEAVEIARDFLRSGALPEDLIVGAQAFAVANQSEGALQLLDSLSNRRRITRLVRAGVELIDSLPPEVDEAQRAEIRNRLIQGRRPAKDSADGG
ncbi:MAG: fused MFS/spermidine synthase [Myxococcales bacterium]|nr:fused MFS/spermidine synthase [Myxococcales bacterium]